MKGCFAFLTLSLVLVIVLQLDITTGQIGATKTKPTQDQLDVIWKLLWDYREDNPTFGPLLMRIAFHHCIGGCDGCVDMTHKDNKGLDGVIAELETLHKNDKIFPFFTKADLIAFATLPVMYNGIFRQNRNCKWWRDCSIPTPTRYQFYWGRKDGCDQISNPNKQVPNGMANTMMSTDEMFDWFEKEFGLSKRETTVLLGGAHSMGRAHLENSGYDGNFTKSGNYGQSFSNKVFRRLTFPKVSEERIKANFPDSTVNKFNQIDCIGHKGGLSGMMLNSEVVATYNLTLDPLNEISCKLSDTVYHRKGAGYTDEEKELVAKLEAKKASQQFCPKTPMWFYAYIYAQSAELFIDDYFDALQKMMSNVPNQDEPLELIMDGLPTNVKINRKTRVKVMLFEDIKSRNRTKWMMPKDEALNLIQLHESGVEVPIENE